MRWWYNAHKAIVVTHETSARTTPSSRSARSQNVSDWLIKIPVWTDSRVKLTRAGPMYDPGCVFNHASESGILTSEPRSDQERQWPESQLA